MTRSYILNRSFSTREKVLILILAVLLLIACYYFLVVKNVADTMLANEERISEIQLQTDTQEALAMARASMESELEGLGSLQSLPEVAVYDNLRNELDELNGLLTSTLTYDLKFDQPTVDGSLVRRNVSVSFTTRDYASALSMIRVLENGSYRCEITDVSLTGKMLADGTIESVLASLNVTFLETTTGAKTTTGLTE